MTTFLLNKMCLENEKKSGKRRFTTFFQKTTVLLLPNWFYLHLFCNETINTSKDIFPETKN